MVERLGEDATFYKIGYELAFSGGMGLASRLVASGKKVFLDLKLHDIPNTIEKATAQIAGIGVTFLTVHAYPQTMLAAHLGRAGTDLQILAVTVLTSMDDGDVANAGYGLGVADLVNRRSRQAQETGIDGLICSAADIAGVRASVGHGLMLVTPGIRPAGTTVGDQKRTMTPGDAIRAGADRLVIGRPITTQGEPGATARAIVSEISDALRA
jgi:orotidine-5'-phosphate decarboxylase